MSRTSRKPTAICGRSTINNKNSQSSRSIASKTSVRYAQRHIARNFKARGERVQLAQLGPLDRPHDTTTAGALHLVGKTPTIPKHFLGIGKDKKTTRVASVLAGFEELQSELDSWRHTQYGLDKPDHAPLCRLIICKLPATFISELRYTSFPVDLATQTNYYKFRQVFLEIAMALDLDGATPSEYIGKLQQGSRSLTEHITALRAFTDVLSLEVQATAEFRKNLFRSFNHLSRSRMASLNPSWYIDGAYPAPDALYRAATAAHRFHTSDDYAGSDDDEPPPKVFAVHNQSAPVRPRPDVDPHLLQAILPPDTPWGPDWSAPAMFPGEVEHQEALLCAALQEVNKFDLQLDADLQACMLKVAAWLSSLGQGTWPAKHFSNATQQAVNNIQHKLMLQQRGLCWNCGKPGHRKAACPEPPTRLTDHQRR
jgi:hypothetical protein